HLKRLQYPERYQVSEFKFCYLPSSFATTTSLETVTAKVSHSMVSPAERVLLPRLSPLSWGHAQKVSLHGSNRRKEILSCEHFHFLRRDCHGVWIKGGAGGKWKFTYRPAR
ncbi:hypothetical protein LEMLEM_LOCUS4068, partial [Lemmus lemmus]